MSLRRRFKSVVKLVKTIAPLAAMAGVPIPGAGALALASKLRSSPASKLLSGLSRSKIRKSLPDSTDSLPALAVGSPMESLGRMMRQPRGSRGSRSFAPGWQSPSRGRSRSQSRRRW